MSEKILVIDDDRKTVELVKLYLESEGYHVFSAHDGLAALQTARSQKPDLLILDLMLPKMDGIEVCRTLRAETQVPIIMLTAKITEEDKLRGLNLGADDYIAKPFSPREVLARVKAVLRRSQLNINGDTGDTKQIRFGNLKIDQSKHEVRVKDFPIQLTPKEFKLLNILASDPGRAFNRKALMMDAFGKNYEGLERTIDVHVMNLRKKIENAPESDIFIRTIYGVGYKLVKE